MKQVVFLGRLQWRGWGVTPAPCPVCGGPVLRHKRTGLARCGNVLCGWKRTSVPAQKPVLWDCPN